jgi:hypothetical protein
MTYSTDPYPYPCPVAATEFTQLTVALDDYAEAVEDYADILAECATGEDYPVRKWDLDTRDQAVWNLGYATGVRAAMVHVADLAVGVSVADLLTRLTVSMEKMANELTTAD